MLTVLAALFDEIKLVRAEMEMDKIVHIRPFAVMSGKFENQKIALVRTGVGKQAMRDAISYCIENRISSLLLSTGYAGGLDPRLQAGDIFIAKSVVDEKSERVWEMDEKLVQKALEVAEAAGMRYLTGRVLTVDKPLSDPHQKAFSGTRFEAYACDMESSVFALLAKESGIPHLIVRSILDPLDTALPDIPDEVTEDGDINVKAIADHLKSHPEDILKLPKMSYLCSQARISITNFIKEWIQHGEVL